MNHTDCAFPVCNEDYQQFGLTKREYLAGMALHAFLFGVNRTHMADKHLRAYLEQAEIDAIAAADELIKALEAKQ